MIYFSETWYQVLGELPDEESGRLVKEILGYMFERKEPAEKSAAYLLMKKEYDRSATPVMTIVETNEREAMRSNEQLINHFITQYQLTRTQVMDYVDAFCDEQNGKAHENITDAKKHFMNWMNVKLGRNGTDKQQQAIAVWDANINKQAAGLFASGGTSGN